MAKTRCSVFDEGLDAQCACSASMVRTVIKNGEFERRPVQIGVSDYFYAEVQKGLVPGETVALEQPPKEKLGTPKPRANANKGQSRASEISAPVNSTAHTA